MEHRPEEDRVEEKAENNNEGPRQESPIKENPQSEVNQPSKIYLIQTLLLWIKIKVLPITMVVRESPLEM